MKVAGQFTTHAPGHSHGRIKRRHRRSSSAVWVCLLAPVHLACGDGPTRPGAGLAFTSVEVGEDHTCGVTERDLAFCWGLNLRGQLGDGSGADRARPTAVAGGLAFSALGAGISHTCGVSTIAAAYCWGRNSEGQLGDGSRSERETPVSVNFVAAAVTAGGLHSCALAPAGEPYCWGSGEQGQLGDGTSGVGHGRDVPGPVAGGLTFVSLDAGGLHSCGITSDGTVYCWGFDGAGALGSVADESCEDGLGNLFACSSLPVPVSSSLIFASVSAGVAHTCAVTTTGAAYCWGRNIDGQLGDGTTTSRTTPVAVSGELRFVAVSAGNSHSCGVTASGEAYCWGGNHRGQLGDGSVSGRTSPALVTGGLTFTSVSAGGAHTCGLTEGGAVYCWGTNADGALGVESVSDTCINVPCSLTPVRVAAVTLE